MRRGRAQVGPPVAAAPQGGADFPGGDRQSLGLWGGDGHSRQAAILDGQTDGRGVVGGRQHLGGFSFPLATRSLALSAAPLSCPRGPGSERQSSRRRRRQIEAGAFMRARRAGHLAAGSLPDPGVGWRGPPAPGGLQEAL